ncbi:unnamed protein product [Acidithrix sp. C25]|nr:unnamed protein product [Acidithrix sp. C25]
MSREELGRTVTEFENLKIRNSNASNFGTLIPGDFSSIGAGGACHQLPLIPCPPKRFWKATVVEHIIVITTKWPTGSPALAIWL